MSVTLTTAGESLMARLLVEGAPLNIDTMLFALVPGQDHTLPVSPSETVPEGHVVYRYAIPQEYRACVNADQVVYSALLGSDMGNFSFNWQGLYCSEHKTLIAAATFPTLEKHKYNATTGTVGNNLTRNFMLAFSGAQRLTGITVTPEVWQLDFTLRLAGMDERERLSNLDLYGPGSFGGDGWKLERNGPGYALLPGLGYVGGVRVAGEGRPVPVTATPCDVWLSVRLKPQGSDRVVEAEPVLVPPETELTDETDAAGTVSRRILLAVIGADGTVTDRRVVWKQNANGTIGGVAETGDRILAALPPRNLYYGNIWS